MIKKLLLSLIVVSFSGHPEGKPLPCDSNRLFIPDDQFGVVRKIIPVGDLLSVFHPAVREKVVSSRTLVGRSGKGPCRKPVGNGLDGSFI